MYARNFAGVSERAGIGEGSGRTVGRRRGDEEGRTALESAAGASERVVGAGTAETKTEAGDGAERTPTGSVSLSLFFSTGGPRR